MTLLDERRTLSHQGSTESSDRPMLVLVAAVLGWMFDGLEMGIFPLVARPALQDLLGGAGIVSDQRVGLWMGYITALFLVGAACGGLLFGWLGDRIGRVKTMAWSVFVYSICTGLCYFAKTPGQLGVLRFLAALGMGGEWSLGVALVMECWPARHRPWLAGFIGAAANIGMVLIAVIGLFAHVTVHSWRWVMLAGAAPAALTFFIRLFVPESEKWKRAVADASATAAAQRATEEQRKEETTNEIPPPLSYRPVRLGGNLSVAHKGPIAEILSPPLLRRTVLAIVFASIALIGTWAGVQWLPLWADKLTGGTVPAAKAMTQIMTCGGAIFGCFFGSWLGGKLGRRPAYFLLCLLSLAICGFFFRAVHAYGGEFLLCAGVTGFITAAFYGWLPLYLPELFPTRVRATGQGLSFNFGRILAAVGAISTGTLINQVYGGSYARAGATITLVYALGLGLIWLAPETRGKPLPE